MPRSIPVLSLCAVAALIATAGFAAEGPRTVERVISSAEVLDLDLFAGSEPLIYSIRRDNQTVRIAVTPDGKVTFLDTTIPGGVKVKGSEGDSVRFRMGGGDQVSMWPMQTLSITIGQAGFSASLGGASWAFVVQADKTESGLLQLSSGTSSTELTAGQRMDLDQDGGRRVFRRIDGSWPGAVAMRSVRPIVAGNTSALERTVEQRIKDGENFEIDLLAMDGPVVYNIIGDEHTMSIRVTPGGLVSFVETSVAGSLAVTGTDGDTARLRIGNGDAVSVWPMRSLSLSMGRTGFRAIMTGADWTFTMRADATAGEDLRIRAGDAEARLVVGERLDLDREGGKTVFRRTTQDWQRIALVGAEERGRRDARVDDGDDDVLLAHAGIMPRLPFFVISWSASEVMQERPVSP